MQFLTEERLKNLTKQVFNSYEILFNRKIAGKFIPDIFIPEKRLIIEFDGFRHFSDAKTVIRDIKLDEYAKKENIDIVHVPYFVQIDHRTFSLIFKIDLTSDIEKLLLDFAYPHGFIDAKVIQGCIEDNEVYYTNSTYLSSKSNVNFIERVTKEGMLHPMIKGGSLTHLWLGTARADTKAVANLIKKIFKNTNNDQIAISPEFTICNNCKRMERGLKNVCSSCGSDNVDGITRITGYFSKTSGWNAGKLAELRERRRESL